MTPAQPAGQPRARWRSVMIPGAAAVSAAIAAGTGVWLATPFVPPPLVSRLMITPPSNASLTVTALNDLGANRDVAITPDGAHVVYVDYVGANATALFVRALDRLEATPLTGLGSPRNPFVSPDGQWIGFADETGLKKVAITGGAPIPLAAFSAAVPRRELGSGRDDCVRDLEPGDWPAADARWRWGAVRADATRPCAGRGWSPLAAIPTGRPGGAVHDRGDDRRTRPGTGRRPRSADRHAQDVDPRGQGRPLRAERPSCLRRGRGTARRRLRPRPARRRRDAGYGRAAGCDDGRGGGQCGGGGQWDACIRTGCWD